MRVQVTRDFEETEQQIEVIAHDANAANWHWHQLAKDVLDAPINLTDWERDFLGSIRFQRKPLTEKQRRVVHKLCLKADL
jgi:hypothetical protein